MEQEKINKLKELRNEIENEFGKDKVWFFPETDLCKGFYGTQNIIFLCLNPSKSNIPFDKKPTDLNFYSKLNELGFENAHITDLIKTKVSNKEAEKYLTDFNFMIRELKFLKKEIEIIKPKLIISLGKSKKELYENCLKDYNIPIINIKHYSLRFPRLQEKFNEDILKIKEQYSKEKRI